MNKFISNYQPPKPNTTAISIILLLAFLIGFGLIGMYAIHQTDKKQCLQWQTYEQNYSQFKVSEKMAEFCSHYSINFKP